MKSALDVTLHSRGSEHFGVNGENGYFVHFKPVIEICLLRNAVRSAAASVPDEISKVHRLGSQKAVGIFAVIEEP